MNREIKFRGIQTGVGRMLYSEHYDCVDFDALQFIDLEHDYNAREQLDNLMEFTGLKDKNGKEIYEGDIVKNHWFINNKDISSLWEIKFGTGKTCSQDYYTSSFIGWYCQDNNQNQYALGSLPESKGIEIIGNIYENPELLKEATNHE